MRHILFVGNDKFLYLIPLLTVSIRLTIFLFIPHTYEDAFITFRYAENLANGNGLVYNLGEKIYGTTTPLFAVLIAGFNLIGVPSIISSLSINLLAEAITSVVVYKLLKDYSNTNKIAATVALLFVFSPSNISWSIQGMETALFGSIIALSFFYFYKKKYFLALLFGFISGMIRIDGLSVTCIICVATIIEKKKDTIRLIILPLSILFLWFMFLYIYFGNILPNSLLAKLILYSGHQQSFLPNLKIVLSKFFISGFYSSSIVTLLFLGGAYIILKGKLRIFPMLIWFILYYLALIFSKTNVHGWYLIPPLFVYIIISGVSIIFIYIYIQSRFTINDKILHKLFLCCILFFSAIVLYQKIIQIKDEYLYEKTVRKKIGIFINQNTPQNSSIFLEPIGVIGYYAERYIYDDAALVSPTFLEFNKFPPSVETRYKKIEFVKPDFLVLRDIYLQEFYLKTNLLNDYITIKNFQFSKDRDNSKFPAMTIFERKYK